MVRENHLGDEPSVLDPPKKKNSKSDSPVLYILILYNYKEIL